MRETEEDMALVECFEADGGACWIEPVCVLREVLGEALETLRSSIECALADLLAPQSALARLFATPSGSAPRRPTPS